MCGWLSEASTCASRLKRASRSGSLANASGRTLMATSRFRRASRARYTSPIPPAPISAVISYAPRRVPGVRLMGYVRRVDYTEGRVRHDESEVLSQNLAVLAPELWGWQNAQTVNALTCFNCGYMGEPGDKLCPTCRTRLLSNAVYMTLFALWGVG